MTSLNSLVVSAPAKVILHGEHAVVYGKAAVAASLGLRTTLTWEMSSEGKVELHLNDLGFFSSWTTGQLEHLPSFPKGDIECSEVALSRAVDVLKRFLHDHNHDASDFSHAAALAFLYLFKVISKKSGSLLSGKFVVKSAVPVGAGLGSSASYSVVLAAALLLLTGEIGPESILSKNTGQSSSEKEVIARMDSLNLINKWAFEGEKLMHGNPSGIDNTMSTFGGFLQFQSGKMEKIKSIPELKILLVNTNIPRSTKNMVGGLKERYLEMPAVYEPLFTAMGEITRECIQLLELLGEQRQSTSPEDCRSRYFKKLEKLIDLNQGLLRIVGVSHATVDEVCEKTLEYGLHSKLTGAGGGGCVVTLINEAVEWNRTEALCKELKDTGCDCWETKLGAVGVFVHEWN